MVAGVSAGRRSGLVVGGTFLLLSHDGGGGSDGQEEGNGKELDRRSEHGLVETTDGRRVALKRCCSEEEARNRETVQRRHRCQSECTRVNEWTNITLGLRSGHHH